MSKKRCLWDESHEYEAKDSEEYKVLCPKCYHNIYVGIYGKTYQWYDFVKNIKLFKLLHQLKDLIDDGLDFKDQFDLITKQIQGVKKTCLMCEEDFIVYKDEEFRYLCNDCYKKYYLLLKDYFTAIKIKAILIDIKKKGGDMLAAVKKIVQDIKDRK